jgi:hypothetical protein
LTEQNKSYWSECGQVFFCDGRGYGLIDKLRSINIGSEDDIKKAFDTGELNDQLQPVQRQVLIEILIYRKEQGIGSDAGTTGMERAGNNGTSRRKQKAARLPSSRKRFPLRPPRTKSKSLSSR